MLGQKQFRGETVEAAEAAAAAWWAQKEVRRFSEYMSPANLNARTDLRWLATIICENV
jgi:hypothetical protein